MLSPETSQQLPYIQTCPVLQLSHLCKCVAFLCMLVHLLILSMCRAKGALVTSASSLLVSIDISSITFSTPVTAARSATLNCAGLYLVACPLSALTYAFADLSKHSVRASNELRVTALSVHHKHTPPASIMSQHEVGVRCSPVALQVSNIVASVALMGEDIDRLAAYSNETLASASR